MLIRICVSFFMLISINSALAATTVKTQVPRPDNDILKNNSPDNTEIEVRLDGDFTGDGLNDVAFVAASEEKRVLIVMAGYVDEFDLGHEPIGQVELETFPLGAASLSFKKGVLVLEDLTGGTTAINALYRYRFDKTKKRMQLIGDDVMQYSRTNAHDSFKVSTNRLTGKSVSQVSKLKGDGYQDQPPVIKTVSIKAIYMEDTPNPCIALGCMEQ
ncbi:MAG TPA: hypothetical protein PLF92_06370 [Arenimonas sp.]|nr:hypothetical protein [Arenimonas sp.]HPO25148.1 hypothetical protein [Arenimonas sp.]HPW32517.1 hypothetical protein [Arenimonas sp.]